MTKTLLAPLLSLLALVAGCSSSVPKQYRPQGRLDAFSYDDWNAVLKQAVTPDGYVRHEQIKANTNGVKEALYRFVGQIGQTSPDSRPDLFPTDADKLAYWINAYNAICMYAVQQRGLPGNVLYSGFPGSIFILDGHTVGGKSMTLDSIEKSKVRSFGDVRIHFALNCMSASCPPLRAEAYEGPRLDEQLAGQSKIALDDPRIAKKKDAQTVALNAILADFWKGDFVKYAEDKLGKPDGTPLDAAKALAGPDSPVQPATKYVGMSYDWSLNRPPAE